MSTLAGRTGLASTLTLLCLAGDARAAEAPPGWGAVPAILARIRPPTFPAREFVVTDYGAVARPDADNTEAIRRAIDACHAAGGGHVVVPAGVFPTGAIHLKSNVDLHLAEGATLRFFSEPAKYLPLVLTRFEGTELMGYSPLIYAFEQENMAVTGRGTLDGGAAMENWWRWKRGPDAASIKRLLEMNERGTPVVERVFGEGHYLRPSFIEPYRCKNVLDRRRHHPQLAHVGDPPGAFHERDRARRDRGLARAQQRRLRSRVQPGRAHRGLGLRHRRRLHRHQVRPQRGRPPAEHALREHRRSGAAP